MDHATRRTVGGALAVGMAVSLVVKVTGHFLDDYWLDQAVTGRTTPRGTIRFVHDGPACVGAVAFLVTRARMPARTFDRTTGKLADWVIPA
jgi:hypothetical protein